MTASHPSHHDHDVESATNLFALMPTKNLSPIPNKTNGAAASRNNGGAYSMQTKFSIVLCLAVFVGLLVMYTSSVETSMETSIVTNVTSVIRENIDNNDEVSEWNYLEERIRKQDNEALAVLAKPGNEEEEDVLQQLSNKNSDDTHAMIVSSGKYNNETLHSQKGPKSLDSPNDAPATTNTAKTTDTNLSHKDPNDMNDPTIIFPRIGPNNNDHNNSMYQPQSPQLYPHARSRWKPISENNSDCDDGFRLANTTNLYCGVGRKSALSPDGYFCGGVPLIPGFCVLPKRGKWDAPSADKYFNLEDIPRRFGSHRYGNDTTLQLGLPRCKSSSEFLDGKYEGEGFDREWVPSSCSSVPLDPYAWTQQKCQSTITMMGDSHIRNLFTATVNGLRGIPHWVEAHPGDEFKKSGIISSYEWRMHLDGSAVDRTELFVNTYQFDPNPFESCSCTSLVVKCLRIAFIWAPTFAEQMKNMNWVKKFDSDLVIVEPGNSYEKSVAVSPEWLEKFDELLEEKSHLHLGIVHWPWKNGNLFEDRKSILTNWTTFPARHASRKSYWLHSSGFYDGKGTIQGSTLWHFACSLGQENILNDRIQAVEPCTDQTDTSQIRAFVTVHFDAFKARNTSVEMQQIAGLSIDLGRKNKMQFANQASNQHFREEWNNRSLSTNYQKDHK